MQIRFYRYKNFFPYSTQPKLHPKSRNFQNAFWNPCAASAHDSTFTGELLNYRYFRALACAGLRKAAHGLKKFYTAAKACAGTCAPEHAGLYCFSWCLCWYHVWKIHTSRGSTSAMIHRSCGFAARPMDHATGENLFMIDFRRYLYQFTTKFSIQLNFVCIAPSRQRRSSGLTAMQCMIFGHVWNQQTHEWCHWWVETGILHIVL